MDIAAEVKEVVVAELGVDEAEVTNEARFIEDLGADSLDTVELIMKFEEQFDLDIPDEDTEGMTTVGDVIKYVEAKLAN